MKKKGFTLIELLAVIVILAIIALIATPLVLKYIEKSRQESKVDSAYSFVRNLETEIANFSIRNNGKKYNGQPSDKGYYELDSFNGSEIDTTVKGDKPNSIKVCLSSLGQVEKAMFEYGKYYVSYDGKKGSISDKDTYDNFSCSGSIDGGNVEEVFTTTVEIIEESYGDRDYTGLITGIENITYDERYYYNLYIDGVAHKGLVQLSEWPACYTSDGNPIPTYNVIWSSTLYSFEEFGGQKYIAGMDSSTIGTHTVKLEKTNEEVYPHAIKVGGSSKEGYEIIIISREFEYADATVVVKDSDGNTLINEEVKECTEDIQPGNYVRFEFYSEEAYRAVEEGKTLIVEVTQVVDGKSITTTLGGEAFIKDDGTYESLSNDLTNQWYWGNERL